jgi:hypothetical protein
MKKLISAYLWAWTNWKAGEKSLKSVRKWYPSSDLFINVDFEGDHDNYKLVANRINATYSSNDFQLGYCGNFGNVYVGYDCWSKESTLHWFDKLYNACKLTNSHYMILLEEDDFILNEISILNENFDMAVHPTNPSPTGVNRKNHIPNEFLQFSKSVGGTDKYIGYGAGGGTVFNREHFINAWDKVRNILFDNYDYLRDVNKIIGWEDFTFQYIMMLANYENIIQNTKLGEHWEVNESWNTFEIITGLKDHTKIEI